MCFAIPVSQTQEKPNPSRYLMYSPTCPRGILNPTVFDPYVQHRIEPREPHGTHRPGFSRMISLRNVGTQIVQSNGGGAYVLDTETGLERQRQPLAGLYQEGPVKSA